MNKAELRSSSKYEVFVLMMKEVQKPSRLSIRNSAELENLLRDRSIFMQKIECFFDWELSEIL